MKLTLAFFFVDGLLGLPLWVTCVFVAAFGAIIGSFLNVVIHRLPREESIVFPNSRCPSCEALIGPLDNIPLISYAILRGRCRKCRAPISWRYPAVELLTAIIYAVVFLCDVYWRGGMTFTILFDLIFVSALIALIFIDAEHMLLPNAITYPGIVFAIIARLALPYLVGPYAFDDLPSLWYGPFSAWPMWAVSLLGACLGALAGGGTLWLVGWLWERIRGVEAMGLGDVKMMFMVGAYLGWRLTILTIFAGVLSGSIIGVGVMMRRRERDMQMQLPFGIFLGIGSIFALLIGSRIITWYVAQF
ncbi:MAG: leader peptidase (prepilin peptidase) / N-methyltransferase [Acidobacteriota bacterium]|jgi:leader peptidase (prepilin peptidase)/N-methyltransferase|nr:leader peptidase (prepilin peptidase) / N-methyltransferase [Acidobacteriota bacterium]